jgi:uncharacterized protein YbjT (DUF2867 family)
MVIIAVAGGTGGVGKTIVESLVGQSQHQVIVLTRSVSPTVAYFGWVDRGLIV